MSQELTIPPVIERVATFQIHNDVSMSEGTEMLSLMNKELDRITKDKEKLTKPLNETLKEIRGRYKPVELALETGIASIRKMMSIYQTEQKRIAEEKANKIALRVGEGKGKLQPETAMQKIDSIETPSEFIGTQSGSVNFRTVRKFELLDLSLVPTEYVVLNETKVREALKNNIEVPGLRYYNEEVPINRR